VGKLFEVFHPPCDAFASPVPGVQEIEIKVWFYREYKSQFRSTSGGFYLRCGAFILPALFEEIMKFGEI
jgi:hypothetical protein